MKKPLPWLIILVLVIVGVGLWRGWFTVSRVPEPNSNKFDVKVRVDPDKVKEDIETVEEEAKELVGKAKDEAQQLKNQAHHNDQPKNE